MKKRTKKWHCLFQYGALYLLLQFFLLAYLQVACQSENALQREPSVRVAITEQNAEALQYLYHSHTNTRNNAARSGFCIRGWLFAVSVLGVAAIRRNLKNRRNAPPISVRCTLLVRQRTPCSESRAFRWQLLSRTPKPCKVRSCRTLIPFPHNTRNNIARSGFCTGERLSAVSVLGATAIRQGLNTSAA